MIVAVENLHVFAKAREKQMPVIAIVGAGPGLGLEIARVFGEEGFAAALISRTQPKLDELAATLRSEGIKARGFAGDVTDPNSMAGALTAATDAFGPIDVLEFSPLDPGLGMVDALAVDRASLAPQLEFYLYGGIAAVQQVLPEMIKAGKGSIIVTTGGGSITPVTMLGNVNIAHGALRNWVLNLHNAAKPHGVHVAHLAISAWINGGHPDADAAIIAREYWKLYENPEQAEHHYIALAEPPVPQI